MSKDLVKARLIDSSVAWMNWLVFACPPIATFVLVWSWDCLGSSILRSRSIEQIWLQLLLFIIHWLLSLATQTLNPLLQQLNFVWLVFGLSLYLLFAGPWALDNFLGSMQSPHVFALAVMSVVVLDLIFKLNDRIYLQQILLRLLALVGKGTRAELILHLARIWIVVRHTLAQISTSMCRDLWWFNSRLLVLEFVDSHDNWLITAFVVIAIVFATLPLVFRLVFFVINYLAKVWDT